VDTLLRLLRSTLFAYTTLFRSRMAHPYAAKFAATGERPHDPQLVAVSLAGARLQRFAVGLGQRDRRPAGATVPRDSEERPRGRRSEEHTSELQPLTHLVLRHPL